MPVHNRVIVQLSQTIGINDPEAIQRILSPIRECGICAFHDQQIFAMERIREGFRVFEFHLIGLAELQGLARQGAGLALLEQRRALLAFAHQAFRSGIDRQRETVRSRDRDKAERITAYISGYIVPFGPCIFPDEEILTLGKAE
jgi:hypothetical protein